MASLAQLGSFSETKFCCVIVTWNLPLRDYLGFWNPGRNDAYGSESCSCGILFH